LKLKALAAENEYVSGAIAPNWRNWACEALQYFGEYFTKPDFGVFSKLVSLGLGDLLFEAQIHPDHLLDFGRCHSAALTADFREKLAQHVFDRLLELDSASMDSNLAFMLRNVRQTEMRVRLFQKMYPEKGMALLPGPEALAAMSSEEKSSFMSAMRRYILAPPEQISSVDLHTRISCKLLGMHFFAYSSYERWMLVPTLPERIVRALIQDEGVHCKLPIGKALVHRVVGASSGPIKKEQFDELRSLFCPSLQTPLLEAIRDSGRAAAVIQEDLLSLSKDEHEAKSSPSDSNVGTIKEHLVKSAARRSRRLRLTSKTTIAPEFLLDAAWEVWH
jgi:signal transduction histidine kinase